MYDATPKRVELQPDDREKMERLSAEVRDRVDEMASIASRTLGLETDKIVAKFDPGGATPASDAEVVSVEIIDLPDGTHGCYVTTSDGGGFCEYPCGAAG